MMMLALAGSTCLQPGSSYGLIKLLALSGDIYSSTPGGIRLGRLRPLDRINPTATQLAKLQGTHLVTSLPETGEPQQHARPVRYIEYGCCPV
eukprot:scaffold647937_cov33-Prasinocladus_malaysianus.AAC.1